MKKKLFTTENIAVIGILTAFSFVLYMFVKFPISVLFPSFLEMQFSDLPALLAGFALGPLASAIVIVLKCVIKMPFTTSACIGELADILVGLAFVVPASLFYKLNKSKRGAVIGMVIGGVSAVAMACIANRFLLIPFYASLFNQSSAESGMDVLANMVSVLYKNVNADNFFTYYVWLAVVPFNTLRTTICAVITYYVYKPLSKYLHWESAKTKKEVFLSSCVDDTVGFAKKFANGLKGGETVCLTGELGAGKTHFAKGLAEGLAITDVITSPTFTLHNVYESGRLVLNHFDFYRIEDYKEVEMLGLQECFGEKKSVALVEWWQNVKELLPKKVITVTIEKTGENSRKITVEK